MKNTGGIRIAIAESSVIIRSGIVAVLKRIPDLQIQPIEIISSEGLENCLHTYAPDILLINPTFGGWFNLEEFRSHPSSKAVKCIALNCNITDISILQYYDDSITLYDDAEILRDKILRVSNISPQEIITVTEPLSVREKEIIVYVVKGMTNKEIAEKLFLSIHTVITHRRNIARKLEIHSVSGLTIYAIVNKLVELSDIKL